MHVNDIQFVPPNFNVDRRNPSDGKTTHFLSCSEDGSVNIWDTRSATQQVLQKTPEATWNPYLQINLFRSDGSGEMGLTRLLFDPKQQMPTFLAASDEGDLVLVDWSIKPP
jgi:WD40 repeat protein